MADTVIIKVYEVVGSPLCVASGDGQKVYEQIAKALAKRLEVDLSFANVQSLTSAFLNAAIGQLYGNFSESKIRKSLKVSEMAQEDLVLLKRVVDTAKQYFKDPERIKRARNAGLGEGNEK